MIASSYNLSPDSIRGRLSRASREPAARKAVLQAVTENVDKLPNSVLVQHDIIEASKNEFAAWSKVDEDRLAFFVSDMHAPYHRLDAYELVLTIASDINPHAITALNDSLDNAGYGRHDDNSPVYQRLWRGDFANARQIQSTMHADFRSVMAFGGKLLGLMGNHDRWIFSHWRAVTPQSAELMIADYMSMLYDKDNVLLFSRGVYENSVHLSEGLVLVHGLSAAKNPNTLAKKAFQHYMVDGRAKSVVQGHTHRPVEVYGDTVGYAGVKFVNSGHLRHNDPDWLAHTPKDWGMGITICRYNPTRWEHDIQLVRFVEVGDKLVARYEGKEYTVKLDKYRPEYL